MKSYKWQVLYFFIMVLDLSTQPHFPSRNSTVFCLYNTKAFIYRWYVWGYEIIFSERL